MSSRLDEEKLEMLRSWGDGLAHDPRDEVRAAFVAWHGGQDILTAPIDKGFNRLAWLFPYVIGITGALTIGLVARHWSRQDAAPADAVVAGGAEDPALRTRLNDELRDLD